MFRLAVFASLAVGLGDPDANLYGRRRRSIPPSHKIDLPVPEFEIDLDAEPEQRFKEVITHFNASIWDFVRTFEPLGGGILNGLLRKISHARGPEPEEFQREINGAAMHTKLPVETIHFLQLLYEVDTLMVPFENITWPWSEKDNGMIAMEKMGLAAFEKGLRPVTGPLGFGCSGIIARDSEDGTVYHGRNLDFGVADLLRPITYIGIYKKGGKEIFRGQSMATYSSIITGMRKGPNGYTVEINTRFADHFGGNFKTFFNLFNEKRQLSGWIKRKTLENIDNYEDAVHEFSTKHYVTAEYNVISGVNKGTILARNADGLAYKIDLADKKYIVMTNFDYIWHDIREYFDPTGARGAFHPRRKEEMKVLDAAPVITPEVIHQALYAGRGVRLSVTLFRMLANVQTGYWNVSLPAFPWTADIKEEQKKQDVLIV